MCNYKLKCKKRLTNGLQYFSDSSLHDKEMGIIDI